MLRRTSLAAAALLAASALALAACSGGGPSPRASTTADPNAIVSIRLQLEPTNLDVRETTGAALDQILIDNVYQGLVSLTPDQKIVPSLASAYTESPDGLSYTFTLRKGVTFHDGQALTPQDVVWSLETRKKTATWVDSDTAGAGAGALSRISSITAEGQTITIKMSRPDSNLLWNLTGRAGLILKQDDTIDYKTAENGTGPFRLGAWKQGDSISLMRFDPYWGTKAKVKEAVFDIIPDSQAAVSAAASGSLDVVTAFDATLSSKIEANGDFTVTRGKATDKLVLAMNSNNKYLGDKRVRQAIRQAIDHAALVKAVGSGSTLYGPIPALDPGYQDLSSVAPYDPGAAKKLLKDAGAEGITLTLTIPSLYGTTIPQVLVSDLNAVGITLKVNSVDFNTWLSNVYQNKEYDLSVVDHVESRDFGLWANPNYYFTYDNAQVQKLYQDAVSATNDQQASDDLAKAAKIVSEDMAADWLYNGQSVVAVGTDITGMPVDNVNSRIDLAHIAKSKG